MAADSVGEGRRDFNVATQCLEDTTPDTASKELEVVGLEKSHGYSHDKGAESPSTGEATVPYGDDGHDSDSTDESDNENNEDHNALGRRQSQAKNLWKFHMRPPDDDEPQDWWFASTAIPLLAATIGPLANVLSIAALVTSWRENFTAENPGVDADAIPYADPSWCIGLNIASLVCGFVGNAFLLFNFTRFVRYIIALPVTIILWFIASGILITITACIHTYDPPIYPAATYSQGFWHAVIAAVLYLCCALMLMGNMLGYFLGHYTQHFELTEDQRNLILQTMMFFIWLAGGAGVFARVSDWGYADALYFCDVTVLTVGFGDFYAPNDVGRGLVFPYSVGGIIMLGLMVSSIHRFAKELGQNKIVRGHVERRRLRTMERSVSSSFEAERRVALENAISNGKVNGQRPEISAPFNPEQRTIVFEDMDRERTNPEEPVIATEEKKRRKRTRMLPLRKTVSKVSDVVTGPPSKGLRKVTSHKGRLLVLKEEKDRFMAMRAIQYNTRIFKRYFALAMSIIAFGLLWCIGAVVFWICEQRSQDMTYFRALYFCYVSLLTIGYGDLSPKSNAGKPFFVVWSLIAVPTMTILISDMSDTVVAAYKRGTFTLAAWTVLPTKGFFRAFLDKHPWIMALFRRLQLYAADRASKKRVEKGFAVGPEDPAEIAAEENGESPGEGPTLEQLAAEEPDEHDLARRLAIAIRRTADDMRETHHRRYTYEEWVEYTRLIRFSNYAPGSSTDGNKSSTDSIGEDRGIVDWDWIGPNSPMMSDQSEAEWVLDRLCESLVRYMRRQLPDDVRERHRAQDAEIAHQRRSSNFSGSAAGPGMAGDRSVASPFSPTEFGPAARRWSVATGSLAPGGRTSSVATRPSRVVSSGLDFGRRERSTGRPSMESGRDGDRRSRSGQRLGGTSPTDRRQSAA